MADNGHAIDAPLDCHDARIDPGGYGRPKPKTKSVKTTFSKTIPMRVGVPSV